jgi:hypothetical protein
MITQPSGHALFVRLLAVVALGGMSAVSAADPRQAHGIDAIDPPVRPARRTHIQPVGEIVAAQPAPDDLGMRLTRASTVLRQQLALARGAGLVVDEVAADSRAARAGFRQHDVLVMLDDQLLLLPEQLTALIESAPAEAPMQCTVLRGGKRVTIPLQVATTPTRKPNESAAARLRPAASSLALIQQPTPAAARQPESAIPGRLTRVSHETLLRNDADYQIRLTSGEETRLVVTDQQGRVVFNDAIDTPEGRSRMPVSIRGRVEEMERSLERSPAAAAEIGRLDAAPILVR